MGGLPRTWCRGEELRRMMAPLADVVVRHGSPRGVVDLLSSPAELELKARRGARIEREHTVVRVLPERLHDADAAPDRAIEGEPDVVHRPDFEHEVMDTLLLLIAERD